MPLGGTNVKEAALGFQIEGEFESAAPYGSGHINDTYCAVFRQQRGPSQVPARFIVQRLNSNVFKNPRAVMENIERVSAHLTAQVAGEPDADRRVAALIPARDGRAWHEDAEGSFWRTFRFIERTRALDEVESPEQAFQAARAFGRFQKLLVDLPAPRLHDTIPDFHHTPKRFAALEGAIEADVANRAKEAKAEIEFALAHRGLASLLLDANLPERVTHNDCKVNNVMLDEATGEGLCVVDLDTVMPGLALYDFGDMVRTATSPAAEDERDLSRVELRFPIYEALTRGYLEAAGGFLTKDEKSHLAAAGKVMTFEQGVRFLADFLAGDAYYKVHREGQNLDRCRAQFRLIESIDRQWEKMERLVESI
jgi:hypothetical protein